VLASACGSLAGDAFNGINLPPTQGSTNAGAFLAGIYRLDYSESDLEKLKRSRFNFLRVCINAETARDPASLNKIAGYFAHVDNQGVICFFDTRHDREGSHGDGKPNDTKEVGESWAAIHSRFKHELGIRYELFNEPFGYPKTLAGAEQYVSDMKKIIQIAKLPQDRCILDGVGYSANLKLVVQAGWMGDLAYHFYPTWVPKRRRTQENYSNKMQSDLRGLSDRVHVTEFGASLRMGDVYNTYTPDGSDASKNQNTLRGFHDAVIALKRAGKGVKSTCHWHGWHNGDSYDFWETENRFGAAKIEAIQRDD
jgi:hypothetical protein